MLQGEQGTSRDETIGPAYARDPWTGEQVDVCRASDPHRLNEMPTRPAGSLYVPTHVVVLVLSPRADDLNREPIVLRYNRANPACPTP